MVGGVAVEPTKEFRVNEYISLKLEGDEAVIYVEGERFLQCKKLIINIPVNKISSFDEIESIDEALERLDKSEETSTKNEVKIPPEVEYWGHCSNLQVWAENNYDTRLLHRNLAFPFLNKLTDIGDTIAKKVFIKEIKKRLIGGEKNIITYLVLNNYMDLLGKNDLTYILRRSSKNFLIKLLESDLDSDIINNEMSKLEKENSLIFEEKILEIFKNGEIEQISLLLSSGVLNILHSHVFYQLIVNLREEFFKILMYFARESNMLDLIFNSLNNLEAYVINEIKDVIKETFHNKNTEAIIFILISNFYEFLDEYEQTEIFKGFKKKELLALTLDAEKIIISKSVYNKEDIIYSIRNLSKKIKNYQS
jgi:hypothetical protein